MEKIFTSMSASSAEMCGEGTYQIKEVAVTVGAVDVAVVKICISDYTVLEGSFQDKSLLEVVVVVLDTVVEVTVAVDVAVFKEWIFSRIPSFAQRRAS